MNEWNLVEWGKIEHNYLGAKGQLAKVREKVQLRVRVAKLQHRGWTLTKTLDITFLSLSSVFPGGEGVEDFCVIWLLKIPANILTC